MQVFVSTINQSISEDIFVWLESSADALIAVTNSRDTLRTPNDWEFAECCIDDLPRLI
jgi:hypothetical protein